MLGQDASRWLLSINAIVGGISGAGLVLVPAAFLGILGISPDASGEILARLYGAELLGFNVSTWIARQTTPAPPSIVWGHVVNESLTAVVLAMAAVGAMGNLLVSGFALASAAFAAAYVLLLRSRG